MSRDASTYRGARRNACKAEHAVWGPEWYYSGHSNAPRWAVAKGLDPKNQAAIYIPAKRIERKPAPKTPIRQLINQGDFAGALRRVFGGKPERTRAAPRGQ